MDVTDGSAEDILQYPTIDFIQAMSEWVQAQRPV